MSLLTDLNEISTIEIPGEILATENKNLQQVKIRPLTVHSFQMIAKAAKNDHFLVPLLMVKESVVEPALNIQEIRSMKVGLVNFLISEIKRISGIIQMP